MKTRFGTNSFQCLLQGQARPPSPDTLLPAGAAGAPLPCVGGLRVPFGSQPPKSVTRLCLRACEHLGPLPPKGHQTLLCDTFIPGAVWPPSGTAQKPGRAHAVFGNEGPPAPVLLCKPVSKGRRDACVGNALNENTASDNSGRCLLAGPGCALGLWRPGTSPPQR